MNPKNLGQTKIYLLGGLVKYKIVGIVRKTRNTLERLQEDCFEVCRSEEQIYSQGFPYHTHAFDLKMVVAVVESQKVNFSIQILDSSRPQH